MIQQGKKNQNWSNEIYVVISVGTVKLTNHPIYFVKPFTGNWTTNERGKRMAMYEQDVKPKSVFGNHNILKIPPSDNIAYMIKKAYKEPSQPTTYTATMLWEYVPDVWPKPFDLWNHVVDENKVFFKRDNSVMTGGIEEKIDTILDNLKVDKADLWPMSPMLDSNTARIYELGVIFLDNKRVDEHTRMRCLNIAEWAKSKPVNFVIGWRNHEDNPWNYYSAELVGTNFNVKTTASNQNMAASSFIHIAAADSWKSYKTSTIQIKTKVNMNGLLMAQLLMFSDITNAFHSQQSLTSYLPGKVPVSYSIVLPLHINLQKSLQTSAQNFDDHGCFMLVKMDNVRAESPIPPEPEALTPISSPRQVVPPAFMSLPSNSHNSCHLDAFISCWLAALYAVNWGRQILRGIDEQHYGTMDSESRIFIEYLRKLWACEARNADRDEIYEEKAELGVMRDVSEWPMLYPTWTELYGTEGQYTSMDIYHHRPPEPKTDFIMMCAFGYHESSTFTMDLTDPSYITIDEYELVATLTYSNKNHWIAHIKIEDQWYDSDDFAFKKASDGSYVVTVKPLSGDLKSHLCVRAIYVKK